jgi:hypothetical protein
MRRPLAIAAVAGGLVIAGGTAIAAAGGPLGGVFGGDERDAELARELASRLDGVSAEQVERALEDLRRDKLAEHRKAEARALAAELDGVSAEDAERALEKAQAQLMRGRDRGEWPRRGEFLATLAKELGKSEREVRQALRAAQRKRFDRMLDRAVKEGRLSEEQADRIRERLRNGPRMLRRGWRRHGGPPGFGRLEFGPGRGHVPVGPPPRFE